MKKKLAYALSVGLIAAGSIVVATPAQAAATATLSPTTDLYPGQDITVTLVDDGTFCSDQMVSDNVAEYWGASADILDSNNTVVGSLSVYASVSYTDAANTYTLEGNMDWLVDDSTPAEAGDYTTGNMTCIAISGAPPGVDANTLAFSFKPISLSATTVAAGGSVDVSVSDSDGAWCERGTGTGYSMGIGLIPESGDMVYVPAGISAGSGVKGNGDFDWQEVSATVAVTIPSDTPPGTYTLFAGCISPEADGYLQPGPGMVVQNFVVTAALANTGLSASTLGATGLAGLTLLALGAGVVIARRRSVDAR